MPNVENHHFHHFTHPSEAVGPHKLNKSFFFFCKKLSIATTYGTILTGEMESHYSQEAFARQKRPDLQAGELAFVHPINFVSMLK